MATTSCPSSAWAATRPRGDAGAIITFTYDPSNPNFHIDHLRRGLIHELHHAARLEMPGWRLTLMELMIMEGLADHFMLEVAGGEVPPWSQALSDTEIEAYMGRVGSIAGLEFAEWTTEFNDEFYVPWFFGRPSEDPIPPWAGYSIGWRLVENYLRLHPGSRASSLVHVPAEQIVEATPEFSVTAQRP